MRRKETVLLLIGVAMLLSLVGLWLGLVRTDQPNSVELPVRPSPVRPAEHQVARFGELPEPVPVIPLVPQ